MKKTTVKILALLLVLVLAIPAFAACDSIEASKLKKEIKKASATELLDKSGERTVDALSSDDSKLHKMLNGGSIGVDFTYEDLDVDGTIYVDSEHNKYAIDALLKRDGQKLDLHAFRTDDDFVVNSQALLKGAIGIDLDTFTDDLEASIFAPGKSDYSLSQGDFDAIIDTINAIKELFPDGGSYRKELEEAFLKYYGVLIDGINEYGTLTVEDGKVTSLGEEIDARIVTAKVNGQQLVKIVGKIWDELKEDEKLKAIFDTLKDTAGLGSYSDFIAEGNESIEDMKEEIDDYDMKITVEVAISKQTGGVVLVNLKLTGNFAGSSDHYYYEDGYYYDDYDYYVKTAAPEVKSSDEPETVKLTLELGSLDEFKGFKIHLIALENGSEEVENIAIGLTIAEDEDGAKTYKAYLKENGETLFSGSLILNSKDEKFTVTVKTDDETVKIGGKYKATKDSATFTLSSIKENNENIMPDDLKLTITLKSKVSMPSVPDYKNFKNLTENDVKDIEERAKDFEDMFSGFSAAKTEVPEYGY